MSDKTLTRMDLAEAVHNEVGLSRNESADLVESVLQHISDALVRGESVKISSFGTFSVREKSARVGRNPKTGEEIRRITISLGVAGFTAGEPIDDAIARADEALYRAKEGGRNRVEVATDAPALAASA